MESSQEEAPIAFPDELPTNITDILPSPSNSEVNGSMALIPEESKEQMGHARKASLMERSFAQVSAVFSDTKKEKSIKGNSSLGESMESGKESHSKKSSIKDVFTDGASLGLAVGLVSQAAGTLNDATVGRILNNQIEEDSNEDSEGSAPELFENIADEIQAVVTDVVMVSSVT